MKREANSNENVMHISAVNYKKQLSEQRQFVHRNVFENLAKHIIWDDTLTQKFALSICQMTIRYNIESLTLADKLTGWAYILVL